MHSHIFVRETAMRLFERLRRTTMKVLGISSGVLGVAFCLLGLALGIELS